MYTSLLPLSYVSLPVILYIASDYNKYQNPIYMYFTLFLGVTPRGFLPAKVIHPWNKQPNIACQRSKPYRVLILDLTMTKFPILGFAVCFVTLNFFKTPWIKKKLRILCKMYEDCAVRVTLRGPGIHELAHECTKDFQNKASSFLI